MYKSLTMTALILAASLSGAAQASDVEKMNFCISEVKKTFGEETYVKFKGTKSAVGGKRVKLKIRPEGGEKQSVTCWVDGNDEFHLVNRAGESVLPEMVAQQ